MDEDAGTAYFHKTLGGYHAAKMKKYQELINFQLGQEFYQLRQIFAQGGAAQVGNYLPQMKIVNMLNAKYIIGYLNTEKGQQITSILNENAYGNAWFVNNVKTVNNADEEILAIREFDPKTTVIVRADEKVNLQSKYEVSESDKIELINYLPNKLTYSYTASQAKVAVFSETFYNKGWKVFVNGEESSFFKVNYILRGMELPKGTGEIVFEFKPKSYQLGENVSLASSIIIVLLLFGAGYKEFKAS